MLRIPLKRKHFSEFPVSATTLNTVFSKAVQRKKQQKSLLERIKEDNHFAYATDIMKMALLDM